MIATKNSALSSSDLKDFHKLLRTELDAVYEVVGELHREGRLEVRDATRLAVYAEAQSRASNRLGYGRSRFGDLLTERIQGDSAFLNAVARVRNNQRSANKKE